MWRVEESILAGHVPRIGTVVDRKRNWLGDSAQESKDLGVFGEKHHFTTSTKIEETPEGNA
jgi:hypothetical protein